MRTLTTTSFKVRIQAFKTWFQRNNIKIFVLSGYSALVTLGLGCLIEIIMTSLNGMPGLKTVVHTIFMIPAILIFLTSAIGWLASLLSFLSDGGAIIGYLISRRPSHPDQMN